MSVALRTALDQKEADHARLFGPGTIGYCPVCSRATLPSPTGPGTAMARVVEHLVDQHDSFFTAILRIHLGLVR